MQNKDKTGIICDICKAESIYKFTYYSYDLKDNIDRQSAISQNPIKSLDVCTECYNKHTLAIIKNYRPNQLRCELTGSLSSKYYYCIVTKVTVDVERNIVQSEDMIIEFVIAADSL